MMPSQCAIRKQNHEAKQFYHHQSDNLGNGRPQATTNLGSSILLKQDICAAAVCGIMGSLKLLF